MATLSSTSRKDQLTRSNHIIIPCETARDTNIRSKRSARPHLIATNYERERRVIKRANTVSTIDITSIVPPRNLIEADPQAPAQNVPIAQCPTIRTTAANTVISSHRIITTSINRITQLTLLSPIATNLLR